MTPRYVSQIERVQLMASARKLWNNGHSPKEIAAAMQRTEDTVRRWLRTTGVSDMRRRRE